MKKYIDPQEYLRKRYEEAQDKQDWKMVGFLEWLAVDWGVKIDL